MPAITWFFTNLLIALIPLAVIIGALIHSNKPVTIEDVIGDGFFFFFTFALCAGLISDCIKDFMQTQPIMPKGYFASAILASFILSMAMCMFYFASLASRFSTQSNRGLSKFSLWVAPAGVIFVCATRAKTGLW